MATVLVTGGTGMIGKALCEALLKKNYKLIVLTREPGKYSNSGDIRYEKWDPQQGLISADVISEANHIIHLAGAGIADQRWSKKRKQEIVESRVKAGELLVKAIKEIPNKIQSLISASATGWYGPDPSIPNPHPFREDAPSAGDYLGGTCQQWEASIDPLIAMGIRVVKLRTGPVMSKEGGMLAELRKPIRMGIATIFGSGRQRVSWIHIDDLVRIYIHMLENRDLRGVFNAVAPRPVSNKELVQTLARIYKGRFFIPIYVPAFVLKIVVGELRVEVLKSVTVSCDKLHTHGFVFIYPTIEPALKNLVICPDPDLSGRDG